MNGRTFVESALKALFVSYGIMLYTCSFGLAAISILVTGTIAKAVISFCGGHVAFWMCMLASLVAHSFIIGVRLIVDYNGQRTR